MRKNWSVGLSGDQFDLRQLCHQGALGANVSIEFDEPSRQYLLRSSQFDALNEPRDVMECADSLLRHVNGAMKIYMDGTRPVEAISVTEFRPDGIRDSHMFFNGQVNIRIGLEIEVSSGGKVTEVIRQVDPVGIAFELAADDPAVSDVLALFQQPMPDWGIPYKIFEIIEENVGSVVKRGWTTKAAKERFTRTADNVKASGLQARHGVTKCEPPPNPMNLEEGIRFIRSLVRAWLGLKAREAQTSKMVGPVEGTLAATPDDASSTARML